MEITLKDLRTLLNNKDALEKYTINIDIVKKDMAMLGVFVSCLSKSLAAV